jgi:hypothetical protein
VTAEEVGELLVATARIGDWLEVTDFAHDGVYFLVMSENLSATLSFDRESATLRAAFEVMPLPLGHTRARAQIMEVLLNANALSRHADGVSFCVFPHNDAVALLANLPATPGGERVLENRLRRMAMLVEAWRPLISSINHGDAPPDVAELGPFLLFRP